MEPMSTISPLLQQWAPGQPLQEDTVEEEGNDDISTTTSTATSLTCFDQDLKKQGPKKSLQQAEDEECKELVMSTYDAMQSPNANNNLRQKAP
jgi:hypothetical protein